MWQTLGFEKNKEFFEGLIGAGEFAHAYLFTGQEMIGKRTFAMEFAGRITSQTNGATALDLSGQPDILIVSPADSESGRSIAIAEARHVKNFVSLSPYAGQYKAVIIDDAHLMTQEAQNALLKILEEPSPSSVMILVSANPSALLSTILSRCQEVKFAPHPRNLLKEILKGSELSEARSEFLAEFANGRLGLIKNVLADSSFDDIEKVIKELVFLIKADINERLAVAQKLTDEKNKADLVCKVLYWQLYMRLRPDEPKTSRILQGLLRLQEIISQPQFNHRLALENFLISI